METSTKSRKGAGGRKGESKKKPVTKSVKADLQFPVGRLARYLKNGRYAKRVGIGAPIFLAAVLEYLSPEVNIDMNSVFNTLIWFYDVAICLVVPLYQWLLSITSSLRI